MDTKLKNLSSSLTNMHYLEVIDWLKDKSEDFEKEVVASTEYFEHWCEDSEDLRSKVSKKIKAVLEGSEK